MTKPFMMNKIIYSVTLTDNNNVYGENVGKKVTEKKSWMKSHRKRSHKKKVTGKKVGSPFQFKWTYTRRSSLQLVFNYTTPN
jgi:hypothetical protein